MKKLLWFWALVVYTSLAWAQASLSDFPLGLTVMKWTARGAEGTLPQELIFAVEVKPDGIYRTELTVRSEGTAAELGAFGFLGSALFVQAFGTTVDLGALQVLIRRKEALTPGERYSLPGGTFQALRREEIAGVLCLVGEYRSADRPNTVVELAFALQDPVFFLPLVRVVDSGKLAFEMQLVSYTRP